MKRASLLWCGTVALGLTAGMTVSSDWFEEHSVPGVGRLEQKLLDDEFPLQARWERWVREERLGPTEITQEASASP